MAKGMATTATAAIEVNERMIEVIAQEGMKRV
jgi:hypothetical protein